MRLSAVGIVSTAAISLYFSVPCFSTSEKIVNSVSTNAAVLVSSSEIPMRVSSIRRKLILCTAAAAIMSARFAPTLSVSVSK